MKIRVIVESMPRCGTHYLIRNLMRIFDWGYCTVHPAGERKGQVKKKEFDHEITYDAGATWYIEDGGRNVDNAKENYVCKAHFTNPLSAKIAPKIYLWGDPLDYAYLTTRLWSEEQDNPSFVLSPDNQHFKDRVGGFFDRLESWLDKITSFPNSIRYEDLLFKQDKAIAVIEKTFGRKISRWEWDEADIRRYRLIFTGWEGKIEEVLARYMISRYKKYLWRES